MVNKEHCQHAYENLSEKEKKMYTYEQFEVIYTKNQALIDEQEHSHSMIYPGKNVIK